MKHYEQEINMLIDDELPENNRSELFSHLANCDECSSLYNDYIIISSKSKQVSSANIEMLKLKSINQGRFYKHAFYFTAAASVMFFMLFLFGKSGNGFSNASSEKLDTVYIQKQHFVKNVKVDELEKGSSKPKLIYNSDKEYLDYINSLRTISFKKSVEGKI